MELARSGSVLGERASPKQVTCRVSSANEPVSRTVVLDIEGTEWSCDCTGRDAVCVHVAAAAIALRQARKAGASLPVAKIEAATVGYRFQRSSAGLVLDRVLVRGGREEPLQTTLSALTSGRIAGPPLMPTAADLEVDVALGSKRHGWFSREVLGPVFDKLDDAADVRLDSETIRLSRERAGVRGKVEDQADGFRLSIEQDPAIVEIFANGVARCGDTLKVVADPPLTGRELDDLRRGLSFGPDRIHELVSEVLPSLRKRIPVDVRTRKLPEVVRLRPRLQLQTEQEGDALSILPSIVYGEPVCARVAGDRLISVGRARCRCATRQRRSASLGSCSRGSPSPPASASCFAEMRRWPSPAGWAPSTPR
ncbi:SWI/SNF family helicase [Vulgatibacter incomptus]|uniref:SWI/SNF family helicase n=1 Tax=Vulgatibacter incomptus TaxID=1391653 RepID=A0A0K1P969_9BACT|nr:SWI/SNF family helicase [Vulgatibacter incomptus]